MSGGLAAGFLDDIVANIDDDTPRLVYADWLEENGHDARSEFIRVQVERSRLPAWDAAQVRLRLREAELLEKHGEEWLAELPAVEGAKWEGFRRGIIAEVSFASFEAMRASAVACRKVAPLEAVTVRWPRQGEAGEATPIAELRELSLTGRPNDQNEIAWLADSPQLATLSVLTARGLWPEGLRRFLTSPHLGGLATLRLSSNRNLGNAGIRALIGTASLTALEELDVSGWGTWPGYDDNQPVESEGVEALAAWPGLAAVRTLKLSSNQVGQKGLRALLHSPYVGALKELSMRSCRLDGPAAAEFRDAPPLGLETLDLGENVLKELGMTYLATARCLNELKSLRLDRCEIPLLGVGPLMQAPFLGRLRLLDAAFNYFGPAGLEILLEKQPAALHTLLMRNNDLFDKGASLLAGSPASDTLLELDLSQNGLSATAATALGDSQHLRKLLILRLLDNAINKSAGATLAASPLGKRLTLLELETPQPPQPAQPRNDDAIPF
jgi:uncharacterized protein (TIGR02996 family)